jgi:quinol monooxygenase YgiN
MWRNIAVIKKSVNPDCFTEAILLLSIALLTQNSINLITLDTTMTILIAGTLDILDGDREKALAESTELMAETRDQKGCSHYVWSADPTSGSRVYVYESWECVEDLAAHLAGTYYAQMLGVLGKYKTDNIEISKYRIDHEEPVYDPQGVPRADFFTG